MLRVIQQAVRFRIGCKRWSVPHQSKVQGLTTVLQDYWNGITYSTSSQEHTKTQKPSPASFLCADMTFSVSLFYKETFICPTLLRHSLHVLTSEIPILSARLKSTSLGWRHSTCVIEPRKEKYNLALSSEKRAMAMQTSMDMLWSESCPTQLFRERNYIHRNQTIDLSRDLIKFDLVTFTDGSVLTMHIAHVLADAGRAVRILEKLSSIYHALQLNASYKSHMPSQYDAWFAKHMGTHHHHPRGLQTALDVLKLDASKLMAIPGALRYYSKQTFISKYLYVSSTSIKRLQQKVSDLACNLNMQPSKLDVVQAILISLIASVRKNRLIPDHRDTVTTNIELSRLSEDTQVPNDIIGNSSHILQIEGGEFLKLASDIDSTDTIIRSLLINSLTLRKAINRFKTEPVKSIHEALEQQCIMSALPKHAVLASFLVNSKLEKLASSTAVASFPMDKVRVFDDSYKKYIPGLHVQSENVTSMQIQFNGNGPIFHHVDSNPKFDWWTIIQHITHPIPYKNRTLSPGYICHMTIPHGKYSENITKDPLIASLSRSTPEEQGAFFLT